MPKRILIVDADTDVRMFLYNSLAADGYEVQGYATGIEAENDLALNACDLLLIDVDLPNFDGLALVRTVHRRSDTAIVIVSNRSGLEDRVAGLDLGADDYVVKPFERKEVMARIRSVLRRRRQSETPPLPTTDIGWVYFGSWALNARIQAVRDDTGQIISLTTAECRLLDALIGNAGQILTRAQLREAMEGTGSPHTDRSIDVAIMRLRKKLYDDIDNPRIVKTIRNTGYIFVAPVCDDRKP